MIIILTLRDYQSELIKRTYQSMATGHRRPLVVSPTGSGKTAMFAWMADKAQLKGSVVWFLVHRKELYDQTLETFERFLIPMKSVYIGMVGQVCRNSKQFPEPDLIIYDEAHHAEANTWRKITAQHPEAWVVGLTATPCRLDGKPLGKTFDDLIVGVDTAELIKTGYLADYKFITSEISLSGLGIVRGDYDQQQAAEQLMQRAVYGDVIETYQKYANEFKAIYFCATIEHSKAMADAFTDAGIIAEHFDGTTPAKQRKQIVQRFRSGKTQILTNVDRIGEGFDMPDCDAVGMLRPTQSLSLYLQQAGRSLRPRENKTAVIIDHVGNLNRHGTPSDKRQWSLTETVKPNRPKNPDGSFQIRQCTECYAVYQSTITVCPVCGIEYQAQGDELREMEHIRMQELDRIKFAQEQEYFRTPEALENARTYSELCAVAKARGYKVGWAYHRAKQKGLWVPY